MRRLRIAAALVILVACLTILVIRMAIPVVRTSIQVPTVPKPNQTQWEKQQEILNAQDPTQPGMKLDGMGNDDQEFLARHESFVNRDQQGPIGICFYGDSITDFWTVRAPDVFNQHYAKFNAVNFAISGDWTQHILWRLAHGELDANKPRVIVLLIGSNNFRQSPATIASGVEACVKSLREKSPASKILLIGLLPRNRDGTDPLREKFKQANALISKLDDGKNVFFLDVTNLFLKPDGELPDSLFPDAIHPTPAGYEIWANAMQPKIDQLMRDYPAASAQQHLTQQQVVDSQDPAKPGPRPGADGNPDSIFLERHAVFVKRDQDAPIGLCLLGDSITDFWSGVPDVFDQHFGKYQPANFGIASDMTQNILWRIANGELDYHEPKAIMLLIGSNNYHNPAPVIAGGVTACVQMLRDKCPDSKILVLGIFPRKRGGDDPLRAKFKEANQIISKLDDGKHVFFMDLTSQFLKPDGELPPSLFPDAVHPNITGYQIWGDAVQAKIDDLMK